jgi:hypothetical protein
MPANEKVDFDLAVRVAELRADVRYAQSDIRDIKAELRATNQRLDLLSQKLNERLRDSSRGSTNASKRGGASN